MRTTWAGLTIDAVDYELMQLRGASERQELGSFRDAFFATQPRWRLVAGYLMLAEVPGRGSLAVYSHGHQVLELAVDDNRPRWTFDAGWTYDDRVARSDAIALVIEQGDWRPTSKTLELEGDAPWAVTIVHGPAPEKIHNRIALLASLRSVGGRSD